MGIFVRRALKRLATGGLVVAVVFAGLGLATERAAQAATPSFVQGGSQSARSGRTTTLAFSQANTAGNLIVAYVIWDNAGTATVTDTRGNQYAAGTARTAWSNGWSSQVFYAKNIAAGANTVTATFANTITSSGLLYLHEYAGIDKVNPLDVSASAIGSS